MNHRCYFGKTQSGKTTKAIKDLNALPNYGRVFINLIDVKKFEGFEQVSKKTDIDLFKNLLRNKRKVQYNCDENTFDKEIILIKKIVESIGNCIVVIDESHLMKKETINEVKKIWTGGRHKNIYGWAISQRPQLLDRTMLTQSELIIFRLDFEDSWLASYGVKETPKENYKFIVI